MLSAALPWLNIPNSISSDKIDSTFFYHKLHLAVDEELSSRNISKRININIMAKYTSNSEESTSDTEVNYSTGGKKKRSVQEFASAKADARVTLDRREGESDEWELACPIIYWGTRKKSY